MSHQDRREPLPKGYQYPTHGVDCDCPPCRNKYWGGYMNAEAYRQDQLIRAAAESAVKHFGVDGVDALLDALATRTQTAYGWGV